MQCAAVRQAMSALADGEPAVASPERVDAHLRDCVACADWQRRAIDVTRRARMSAALPDHRLADRLVRAAHVDAARRRARRQWMVVAGLVAVSGALQVFVSVPLLLLSHHGHRSVGGAGLVVMELVVGASFFVGAVVLLWHARGVPVDPPAPLESVVDRQHAQPRNEGVA